jgi:hypothetical protein
MLTLLLAACTQDAPAPPHDTGAAPVATRHTLRGNIHYEGSCAYTLEIDGFEDNSTPWICVNCTTLFRVDLSSSDVGCSGTAQVDQEYLGWDGEQLLTGMWTGAGVWESAWGPVAVEGTTLVIDDRSDWGASTGELELGQEPGEPAADWDVPETSACGWEPSDATYDGDYRIEVGARLPDGLLVDRCDEAVRVYDVLGPEYTVVEVGGIGCAPCTLAANTMVPELLTPMDALGIDVAVRTIMVVDFDSTGVSLGALSEFADETGHEELFLDRYQWAASAGNQAGTGSVPVLLLVGPDGTVLHTQEGFDGWSELTDVIEAHHAR